MDDYLREILKNSGENLSCLKRGDCIIWIRFHCRTDAVRQRPSRSKGGICSRASATIASVKYRCRSDFRTLSKRALSNHTNCAYHNRGSNAFLSIATDAKQLPAVTYVRPRWVTIGSHFGWADLTPSDFVWKRIRKNRFRLVWLSVF